MLTLVLLRGALCSALLCRVRQVALQTQVSQALNLSAQEINDRMSWLSLRLMELRRVIQESLELLRALIRVGCELSG